jgi:hypothetical protein
VVWDGLGRNVAPATAALIIVGLLKVRRKEVSDGRSGQDTIAEVVRELLRDAGEIELQIPRIRQSSYFPSFLRPRKRSEQALVSVVQQAYICGVSTRRVDQLVESFGPRISRSEVRRKRENAQRVEDAYRAAVAVAVAVAACKPQRPRASHSITSVEHRQSPLGSLREARRAIGTCSRAAAQTRGVGTMRRQMSSPLIRPACSQPVAFCFSCTLGLHGRGVSAQGGGMRPTLPRLSEKVKADDENASRARHER